MNKVILIDTSMKKVNYKQKYLVDQYTTLDVKNPSRYQEFALLVDRVDFINEIIKLRESLRVVSPVVVNMCQTFGFHGISWTDKYQAWKNRNGMVSEDLISEIKQLLIKFRKPSYFLEVIEQVVLFKSVSDDSRLVKTLDNNCFFIDQTIGIFPLASTTKAEMDLAWEEVKKWYKNHSDTRHQNLKSEFKRNRDWHWRNIRGESYKAIAYAVAIQEGLLDGEPTEEVNKLDDINRGEIPTLARIRKAIREYRMLLE